MAATIKIIISSVFLLLLVTFAFSSPAPGGGGKSHKRVRIHVPVKHHTHVITKTQVKTVHIPVLIKEKPKKSGWESQQWAYSKKKPRIALPDDI